MKTSLFTNMAILFVGTLLATQIQAATKLKFSCTNRQEFQGKLEFSMFKTVASLTYDEMVCPMGKIEYNPVSDRYKGWIRFGAKSLAKACDKIAKALFGGEKRSLYWISVSTEMQDGEDGFAQLGYQNTADPGAGPEAKTFLNCKEDSK